MKLRTEAKVGIFALAALAFLYWGINFLKGQDLFHRNKTYYATYGQVNGLQRSSAIVIKGVKVGVISDIDFDPQRSDQVVVSLSIKSKYKVPENSKARIFSDGLLGSKAIEIELGSSQRYLEDGDTLRSEFEAGLLDLAGSELEFIKQKIDVLTNDLGITLSNINSLIGDNSESINAIFSNLAGMTGTLNNVITSEERSLKGIISDINELSTTIRNNTGRIDNIIGNVEGFTDTLSRMNLPELFEKLSLTVVQFNGILEDINNGEGSVGKLIGDDGLYDSLVEASANLARLLEDVKENPSRYVNISVFGGGKKNK